MKKIKVRIEGISPLLQHRFPEEDAETEIKTKNRQNNEADVEKSLYRLPDGTIYQPATHIISALKRGGVKFQIKGSGKQTYKNIIGSGAVTIEPDAIPHKNQNWEVDSRPVVNPSTRGRVIRKRPVLKNWSLQFVFDVDEDEIPIAVLKEILDRTGRSVGIGDFRPEKGGPFGRFLVSEFKEIR
jgi:hypothetical protein